jgi:hypothetical protein
MPITVRREDGQGRIVVVISGALDAGAVPSLRRVLVKALRTREPILIDLTEATSPRSGLYAGSLTTAGARPGASSQALSRSAAGAAVGHGEDGSTPSLPGTTATMCPRRPREIDHPV